MTSTMTSTVDRADDKTDEQRQHAPSPAADQHRHNAPTRSDDHRNFRASHTQQPSTRHSNVGVRSFEVYSDTRYPACGLASAAETANDGIPRSSPNRAEHAARRLVNRRAECGSAEAKQRVGGHYECQLQLHIRQQFQTGAGCNQLS